jgi:N-acetylneuraminic acid mutarotase
MLSGGCQGNISTLTLNALTDVHVFDPATENWQPAPYQPLPFGRAGHTATLLTDGTLVICGGASGDVLFPTVTTDVSIYDGFAWTTVGALNHERAFHYAALTEDSQRIFLYGGIETGGISALVPTCELFAP